jgi:hypothetical protein
MKLITHIMLTLNIPKDVTKGFALKIQALKVERLSTDSNRDFINRILVRIEDDASSFTEI